MAGSLILLDEETVSSGVSSVTLGASDWDSSYDVYMVTVSNMQIQTNNTQIRMRFLAGGTPQSTTNYDYAYKVLKTGGSYADDSSTQPAFILTYNGGSNLTDARFNMNAYLFNMNTAADYSYATHEVSAVKNGGTDLESKQGGGVYLVTEAHNGVEMLCYSGNIEGGEFKLYGIKK
tara:strand:+ start:501 stop:1028 length:528 start_codon:yes stop_codon:yes gene_type:complete